LWWILGGALALVLLVGVGGAVVLWRVATGSTFPSGWHQAAFSLDTATDERSREDLGRVLAHRLTRYGVTDARFIVRDPSVLVGVPADRREALDRLKQDMPLRLATTFRPVVDQQPVEGGSCPSADGYMCAADGKIRYRLSDPLLDGTGVRDATTAFDQNGGGWKITVTFTPEGQQAFTDATREYTGQQLAVTVADVVVMAPTLQSVITGPAEISGSFNQTEAAAVAATVRLSRRPGDVKVSDVT
jgi:hypothetical protein